MRCGRRVTRLLAGVGILTIGFASVAQAAGVDRKAYRAVRESRVTTAGNAWSNQGSNFRGRGSDSGGDQRSSQRSYVRKLLATASSTLAYENVLLGAENRLIAQQNRVIQQLNGVTNPFSIRELASQGYLLQFLINQDLKLLDNAQNVVNSTLAALAPYSNDSARLAAAISRLDSIAAADAAEIAVIAARPPFTYPPATPGI